MTFIKQDNETLREEKVTYIDHNIKRLKEQLEMFKNQKLRIVAEIDRLQALILEAKNKGIE